MLGLRHGMKGLSFGCLLLVQSVLLFSLGFLSAAFLALMVAPAIWGRAVALTKKRIEATVPLDDE